MNFRDIWTVTKKELKAGFTDKLVLFQVLFMPFLIVFGYATLMMAMGNANENVKSEEESIGYYVNAPEYMAEGLKGLKLKSTTEDKIETLKSEIKDKECNLLVVFPTDFAISDGSEAELSNIEIWYNSSDSESYNAYYSVNMYFTALQPKLFSVNGKEDVDYDMGDEDAMLRDILAGLMPIMLLMGVYMVVMNQASESIAGDKERGFLNTMLITPVKRSSIAAGKALYMLIISVLGGLSAFIGMSISLPRMAEAMEIEKNFNYNAKEYLLLFVVTITAVFALVGVLLIVSTLSKDVKQSTTFSPIIMMILMICGMLATTEAVKPIIKSLGMVNNIIPAWNSMILLQNIIKCEYSLDSVLIASAVNLIFSVVSIFIIGKCFESEKILNG